MHLNAKHLPVLVTAVVLSAPGTHGPFDCASSAGEPVVVRLVNPDQQAKSVLDLFKGNRAAHPAAALAAWKRATIEPNRLGKTTEAIISFFNPEMVPEWQALHDARFELGIEPGDPRFHWRLTVPHEQGTFAALVTAVRLSGERPIEADADAGPVGRGDVVARRAETGLVVASSPAFLPGGGGRRDNPQGGDRGAPDAGPGLHVHLEPQRIPGPSVGNLTARRALELARGLGCSQIDGRLAFQGDSLVLEARSDLLPPSQRPAPEGPNRWVEEEWLAWMPSDTAAVVVSLATGRRPQDWDYLFSVADRIDRADPARANLAPLRVRLNVLAAAAGARPEVDLWPHLRGLTLGLLVDPSTPGKLASVLVCLHLDTEASASRLERELFSRRFAIPGGIEATPPGRGTSTRIRVRLAGRPVEMRAIGSTVVVGWGEGALTAGLHAHERPDFSVARWYAHEPVENSQQRRPDRIGLIWPGRLALPLDGLDGVSPLARSLAAGPPVVWTGWTAGCRANDRIRWCKLPESIRRFLASIPLDPR